jgi:NADP-dependent aldehyde dehydrogenase
MTHFPEATVADIDQAMQLAAAAFASFRQSSPEERAVFLETIGQQIEALGDALIETAMAESNLPQARLLGERGRTVNQLRSFADMLREGSWVEATIDTALPERTPPRSDIRKMLIPLGPVVVFGAANFPLAFSTAGGDTASALAAGCPVVVKAHPGHPLTSGMVAGAIQKAIEICKLPAGTFQHVYGSGFDIGKALVQHPVTQAVGFTGSLIGGLAIRDYARLRPQPIPVFAEMGSVNPVYLLEEKLSADAEQIATQYSGSITLGVGQFCTKPGLIFGVKGEGLDRFMTELSKQIGSMQPGNMLHAGIAKSYQQNKENALAQEGISILATSSNQAGENQGAPTIAKVTGKDYLSNSLLHQEVFGPYSLVVECEDADEMLNIAESMEGQITTTVMGTDNDIHLNELLFDAIADKCGRIILNGVPTGVEVCLSMHHGGPFPATTDSRFTSVGADAIKRFARPMSFQNFANHLLPQELQNENPLKILRTVNDNLGYDTIS